MKTLVKKIAIYLFPFLLIFVLIEIFYKTVPNDYSYKFKTIPKKTDKTETLIFGNSHPYYGLNPIYFHTPTYNLSHVSQTIYFDKLLFDEYIHNFKNLKTLVLHIEYTSLSELVDTRENNWRKYYYQCYMKMDIPSISKYDFTKCFISSTRTFNENLRLLQMYYNEKSIVNCDENGFGTNYIPNKKNEITKKMALERVNLIEDNLMDFKENILRIENIINVCKKRNIKVVLLTLPVSNYFYEGLNPQKIKKIEESCFKLKKENENVYYLNLFQNKKFSNDDFFDADHLHSDGAKKSSKILNDYIMKL